MKNIYNKLIDKFGCENQLIIAIEELSELQKEITKHLRKDANMHHLISEMADVEIMLEQMKLIFDCTHQVESTKQYKLFRTYKRYFDESEG